jgi:hypothetical protein
MEDPNSRQIDLMRSYHSQQRVAATEVFHWHFHREDNPDGQSASETEALGGKAPRDLTL